MPSNKKQLESALRRFRRLADAAYQDNTVMEKWELAWWLYENTIKGRKQSKYDISIADLGPISPYGRTKAVCEGMFADIAAAEPIKILSLRYFNPIGADPQLRSGLQNRYPTHALGKLIEAHEAGRAFQITGTDYPTRDGTGVKDYIHIWDLAAAHVAALTAFDEVMSQSSALAINLGTGTGTTVRELVEAFNSVVDPPVEAVAAPRRPGDTAGGYTRSDRARELLGWQARYSIADGIRDSLRWAAIRDEVLS